MLLSGQMYLSGKSEVSGQTGEVVMRTSRVAFVAAVVLLGLQSRTCQACSTPRLPPASPCIGFVGNSLILELGTIFQTSTLHSCAAAIGLQGAPPGLNFSVAGIGVVNTVTNVFTPTFNLNRLLASDNAWATGTDINSTQALPGATWFGFSNLTVPPITPPALGANEIFAINFNITGSFNPLLIQGLRVQYGSGSGTATGLPDFMHTADLTHSAQFSRVVNVPTYGTNNWAVPEPTTTVYAISALMLFAGRLGVTRMLRFKLA